MSVRDPGRRASGVADRVPGMRPRVPRRTQCRTQSTSQKGVTNSNPSATPDSRGRRTKIKLKLLAAVLGFSALLACLVWCQVDPSRRRLPARDNPSNSVDHNNYKAVPQKCSVEEARAILLDLGASGMRCDDDGNTPLHWAAWIGDCDRVKHLLYSEDFERFAERIRHNVILQTEFANTVRKTLIAKTNLGNTPLHRAAYNGQTKMVKLLLSTEEKWNSLLSTHGSHKTNIIDEVCENGHTPLFAAAHYGRLETLRTLIAYGANTKHKNKQGQTALHIVAYKLKKSSVKLTKGILNLLIQNGAELEEGDEQGYTAIHHACYFGNKEKLELLLDLGADIEARGTGGFTPLLSATLGAQPEIVLFLLEKGARWDVVANGPERILHVCERSDGQGLEERAKCKKIIQDWIQSNREEHILRTLFEICGVPKQNAQGWLNDPTLTNVGDEKKLLEGVAEDILEERGLKINYVDDRFKTFTFETGDLGFTVAGQEVSTVSNDEGSQAHTFGVKEGWIITEIGGIDITSPEAVGVLESNKQIAITFNTAAKETLKKNASSLSDTQLAINSEINKRKPATSHDDDKPDALLNSSARSERMPMASGTASVASSSAQDVTEGNDDHHTIPDSLLHFNSNVSGDDNHDDSVVSSWGSSFAVANDKVERIGALTGNETLGTAIRRRMVTKPSETAVAAPPSLECESSWLPLLSLCLLLLLVSLGVAIFIVLRRRRKPPSDSEAIDRDIV